MPTDVRKLTDEELEQQLQELRTSAPVQVVKRKKTKEKQLTVDDLQNMLTDLKANEE